VLTAFVLVDAVPARIAALAGELADLPGVAEVYSVAGGVADIVAIVRVRHHDDLVEVVTGRIDPLPGIESTTTLVEAMFDIGPA
jgi:DNA-binding Lrp family transcriptional regulator